MGHRLSPRCAEMVQTCSSSVVERLSMWLNQEGCTGDGISIRTVATALHPTMSPRHAMRVQSAMNRSLLPQLLMYIRQVFRLLRMYRLFKGCGLGRCKAVYIKVGHIFARFDGPRTHSLNLRQTSNTRSPSLESAATLCKFAGASRFAIPL